MGVSPGRLTRGLVSRNKPHPRPWSVPSCGGAQVRPKRGACLFTLSLTPVELIPAGGQRRAGCEYRWGGQGVNRRPFVFTLSNTPVELIPAGGACRQGYPSAAKARSIFLASSRAGSSSSFWRWCFTHLRKPRFDSSTQTKRAAIGVGRAVPGLTRGAPTLLSGPLPPHLAFTRYCFASKLYCESQSSLYCPPHLQSLPYCDTIARPLRNIRPSTDPPFACHTPYNIGDGNIV